MTWMARRSAMRWSIPLDISTCDIPVQILRRHTLQPQTPLHPSLHSSTSDSPISNTPVRATRTKIYPPRYSARPRVRPPQVHTNCAPCNAVCGRRAPHRGGPQGALLRNCAEAAGVARGRRGGGCQPRSDTLSLQV
eukprot:358483-Chlamydomonas_euryale.AAC.1